MWKLRNFKLTSSFSIKPAGDQKSMYSSQPFIVSTTLLMLPLHHPTIPICNTIIFIRGKLHHKPFFVKSLWLWCYTQASKSSGTSGPLNFHHHCWVAVWVSRVIVTPSQLVFPSFSPKPHHGGSIGGDAHNFEGILSPWLLWWWWLQCEGGHIYSHGNCIDDKNVCDRNPR